MSSATIGVDGSGRAPTRRYNAIAIGLHWAIALLIYAQLGLGWYMNEVLPDHSAAQDSVEAIHISLGLTTLMFIAARITVRLIVPPPALPSGLQTWEVWLSHASKLAFYLLMLALPLSGWALVSAGHDPIPFWGASAPKLPVTLLTGPAGKGLRHTLKHVHVFVLIWILVVTFALHVMGALKHQFDGHPVLWRMVPFLKARP
jgi:cytochrome b561